jgi:hypothetical protein
MNNSDAYQYYDPAVCYALLMMPAWTSTAITVHPSLSGATAAAWRRFTRQGTGKQAYGAAIIEIGVTGDPPWYMPTGRTWHTSPETGMLAREVKANGHGV